VKKSEDAKQTEQKRRIYNPEAVIAEQEAILNCVGDHIMAVIVVDKKGKIIRGNKGFEALTGWEIKEVIGKSLISVIPRKDEQMKTVPFKKRILSKILLGKILASTATVAAGGIEKMPIFYYIRKDKSKFPATSVISPMLFEGKVMGAVEVFYDITKEKELEQIRMDFLSLASHQLRTPLSGTKWLIETMCRGVLGEMTKKQKEYLDDIYKVNEQLIKLVSDILSTLRLESEEPLMKKERISVTSLVKEVMLTVSAAAKEKKLTLKGPSNHRTLNLKTDTEILKSILGTFLANAIDYSLPDRKVVLKVESKSDVIIFSVHDSGIGIPLNEQKRVFERFYRASNAKNLRPTGTGLGLNIAKMLSDKIGAKISFKSKENKGSVFYLHIPKKFNTTIKINKKNE